MILTDGDWTLSLMDKLPEGTQPQISVEELIKAEVAVRSDERVQALAKEVGKYRQKCAELKWNSISRQVFFLNRYFATVGPLVTTSASRRARECSRRYYSPGSHNMIIYTRILW